MSTLMKKIKYVNKIVTMNELNQYFNFNLNIKQKPHGLPIF